MTTALFTCYLNKYAGYVDGGMGLTFVTGELDADAKAQILELHRTPVTIYATEGEITEEQKELLDEQKPQPDSVKAPRSPSQKLRFALMNYWESDMKINQKEEFQAFYERKMGDLIESVKEKIK